MQGIETLPLQIVHSKIVRLFKKNTKNWPDSRQSVSEGWNYALLRFQGNIHIWENIYDILRSKYRKGKNDDGMGKRTT